MAGSFSTTLVRRAQEASPSIPDGYYVYRLIDPRTNAAFYVGKGQGRRAWSHERRLLSARPDCRSRKDEVILEIVEAGLSVGVEIVERFADADDALDLEYRLIRDDPSLTNDRSGWNNGDQVATRLHSLRKAKHIRLQRQMREAEMLRERMGQMLKVTRDPARLMEAERWIRREIRENLMRSGRPSKVRRRKPVEKAEDPFVQTVSVFSRVLAHGGRRSV